MPDGWILLKLLLILVFSVAGAAKLADRPGTRQALRGFQIPEAFGPALEWALPLSELAIAAALFSGRWGWWGALGALAMLFAFTVAIVIQIARGRRPDCHCFGQIHSAPVGRSTIIRNALLTGAAALLLGPGRAGAETGVAPWFGAQFSAGGGALAAGALLLALAEGVLLLRMAQQNGEQHHRLAALEARLSGLPREVAGAGAPADGLPVGEEAPPFELPDVAGEQRSLDHYLDLDRPVLLFFVSPDCPSCKELIPEIHGWRESLGDRVTLLLVSVGKDQRKRADFSAYGDLPLLLDEERTVRDRFLCKGTPSAVLIQPDGSIGSAMAGGPKAIRALVAGVDLELDRKFKPLLKAVQAKLAAEQAGLPPGGAAPLFRLSDLHGAPHALSDYRGRKVLVLFFSPACGFCVRMMPALAEYCASRAVDDPQVLVTARGGLEENRAWVEEHDVRCPVLLDVNAATAGEYRASGTPIAYLVDEEGRIASEMAAGERAVLQLLHRDAEPAIA